MKTVRDVVFYNDNLKLDPTNRWEVWEALTGEPKKPLTKKENIKRHKCGILCSLICGKVSSIKIKTPTRNAVPVPMKLTAKPNEVPPPSTSNNKKKNSESNKNKQKNSESNNKKKNSESKKIKKRQISYTTLFNKIKKSKKKRQKITNQISKLNKEIKAYRKGYHNILVAKNNKMVLRKLNKKTDKLQKLKRKKINIDKTIGRQMDRLKGLKKKKLR